MDLDVGLADRLIQENILTCQQECVVYTDKFVLYAIRCLYSATLVKLSHLAMEILSAFEKLSVEEKERHLYIKIHLLKYLGKYDDAAALLSEYMLRLQEEKEYTLLLSYLDIAIEIARETRDPLNEIRYIIEKLHFLVVTKEILSGTANELLTTAKQLLKIADLNIPEHYHLAVDYFEATRSFKNGIYDTNTGIGRTSKQHYLDCINCICRNNKDDWLGKICTLYALCVKESCGNKAALAIFERAREALPGSFNLMREYYSHMGCIYFFDAPEKSFNYYEKIFELFKKEPSHHTTPFHEYGDSAICKVLKKDSFEAEQLAEKAIQINETNWVLDELGRALNIKGCALLQQGQDSKAKKLFKESYTILKSSNYVLYCWRSQLNYVQLSLRDFSSNEETKTILDDAYSTFKKLFKQKIKALSETESIMKMRKTREYHALLIFEKCYIFFGKPDLQIFKEFEISSLENDFKKDLSCFLKTPCDNFLQSPYWVRDYIIMIG